MRSIRKAEIRALLPRRAAGVHKGDAGHLLIVAGSPGKGGAAVLAARGALRGGAGLVTVATPAAIQPQLAQALPEAMTITLPMPSDAARQELVGGRKAFVIGPGLGQGKEAGGLLRWLLRCAALPAVLDADALNLLAPIRNRLRRSGPEPVLTPHPGEMARLLDCSVATVQADRVAAAQGLAETSHAVVVLKGAGTLVAAPDGRIVRNPTGGPLLATGGTGDVLAGLLGALLAQGLAPFDAARYAVWLHGAAGDRLARRYGDAGLLASELADELPLTRHALHA
ncbi:MAG: NAD(P)H-hydrate dehydratase [Deltaproteobacteria bacterium]